MRIMTLQGVPFLEIDLIAVHPGEKPEMVDSVPFLELGCAMEIYQVDTRFLYGNSFVANLLFPEEIQKQSSDDRVFRFVLPHGIVFTSIPLPPEEAEKMMATIKREAASRSN